MFSNMDILDFVYYIFVSKLIRRIEQSYLEFIYESLRVAESDLWL